MREIKFRAWDYYEKKMYEVGGIDFFWGIIKLQWWHRTEDGMDRRKTKEMDMDIDKELHELFGVELMEFTGLKDKNGKEIYEGDIVRCYGGAYWNGIYEYNYVIEVRDIRDLNEIVHSENVEILGNKYENPELLEGRE